VKSSPNSEANVGSEDRLFRYTNFMSLMDILVHRRLTLLNPKLWDDHNDAWSLEWYRRAKSFKSVLALCFSECSQTYQHWKVFSPGEAGVCIEFDKESLVRQIRKQKGLVCRSVAYYKQRELEDRIARDTLDVDDLPFVKGSRFSNEKEFRVIFGDKSKELETKSIEVELGCINRVTLGPWLPQPLRETVKATIRDIYDSGGLKVVSSTLTDSKKWKSQIERIARK
jgi:Protein of unknown function (DUF2971)